MHSEHQFASPSPVPHDASNSASARRVRIAPARSAPATSRGGRSRSEHVAAVGAAVVAPKRRSQPASAPAHHRAASVLPRQILCTVTAPWSLRLASARSSLSFSRRARSSSLVPDLERLPSSQSFFSCSQFISVHGVFTGTSSPDW